MRYQPVACLLAILCCTAGRADDAALKEARKRWLLGNVTEAQKRFEALLDRDKSPWAVLGLSRCLESQGEYDRALTVVETAIKNRPKDAKLKARQAELLHLRGRWDDAFKAAAAALEDDRESFLAHWIQGQVHRERGDIKKADTEFRWLVRTYTQRSNDDKDVTDPDDLLVIGLAGAENARWNRLSDQFEVILQDVWGDALKNDKAYWLAEHQAGMLLLEKYNRADGLAALDKALAINPNAPEALVGKGVAALQRLEIQDAERFAERALKINGKLPDALRLRADVHLAVGHFDKALKELETARQVNPRDEQTLGRLAACLAMQKKNEALDALVKEVQKHNTTPGVFHLVLAQALEDRRRYDDAEKHYRKAKELRPVLYQATGNLGMLYMRLGKEKEATALLDDAFKADPFNVRISNTRKVLTHLEKYKTLKTAHFELKYDEANDGVLAAYMGDFLEKVYDELAAKFNHKPKGPILIEVFNNHTMFSGRTIALPDLHTIGACTGRMVAMVSPKGKGVRKSFNWARVMRHELVHIFNLDQTDFLCPHWFTEGLAVISEGLDRPQTWNDMLRTRVPSGDLLNLDTIDLGFIRPRSPSEWQLAYCQAQLYVEYLEKTHGKEKIGEMLEAYRAGMDTVSAIQKVCKLDRATFEKGYKKHLEELVQTLGGKSAEGKPMTLNELRDAHKDKPDDLEVAARLAEKLLRGNKDESRKLAKGVLEKKPGHPRASVVLARLDQLGGDSEKARELLEKAYDKQNPDIRVLRALGKLYFEANDLKQAAPLFEKGHELEPFDREWLSDLVRLHGTLGSTAEKVKYLEKLVKGDGDDLENRKTLARLLAELKKHPESERYAREALEIDVTDGEAKLALFRALEEQKKDAEVMHLRKILAK